MTELKINEGPTGFDGGAIMGIARPGWWRLNKREKTLAVIGLFIFLLILVFAGLLTHEKITKVPVPAPTNVEIQGIQYCHTDECIKSADRAIRLMNLSMDPCTDFYNYACGNYNDGNWRRWTWDDNVLRDIDEFNEDRLMDVLQEKVRPWNLIGSAKAKAKKFYQMCMDVQSREKQKGTPFINQVVGKLGGWDLLGNWDEEKWDFNDALKKVQADFWVSAFYESKPVHDESGRAYDLQISQESHGLGIGLNLYGYSDANFGHYYKYYYDKFMRKTAELFIRDANLDYNKTFLKDKVDQFINDASRIDVEVAKIKKKWHWEPPKKVSLKQLSREMNFTLDWVNLIGYLLPYNPVRYYHRVLVTNVSYLKEIATMISKLKEADKKRMLHHFLIWRLVEFYAIHLSTEYLNAYRDFFRETRWYQYYHFNSDGFSVEKNCFKETMKVMRPVLGHIFIKRFFSQENKDHVYEVSEKLKKGLHSQLDDLQWMDNKTRAQVRDKLTGLYFKLGYPDWMNIEQKVDRLYCSLKVQDGEYFQAIIASNEIHKNRWTSMVQFYQRDQDWPAVFDASSEVVDALVEVIATAGYLQDPIYDYQDPDCKTFGSLGTILGGLIYKIIDSEGQTYDKDGNKQRRTNGLWTDQTQTNFEEVEKCYIELYKNFSTIFYGFWSRRKYTITNHWGYKFARDGISEQNGVSLAWRAYQDVRATRNISQPYFPGVNLTNSQMFFLSYAQNNCADRHWVRHLITMIWDGKPNDAFRVNGALGQLKDFASTFQCADTDAMVNQKKCENL